MMKEEDNEDGVDTENDNDKEWNANSKEETDGLPCLATVWYKSFIHY